MKNVLGGLPNDKFFCSGALLRVQTEHPELPANFGLPAAPVVMFERGPAFETLPGFKGAVLARYAKQADPLESGMILHGDMLAGKAAALELSYGRGRILLFGFKPQHRGQAHGTYRYLFNALYRYDNPPASFDIPGSTIPTITTVTKSGSSVSMTKLESAVPAESDRLQEEVP